MHTLQDKQIFIQGNGIDKNKLKVYNSDRNGRPAPPLMKGNHDVPQRTNKIKIQCCTYKDNRCFQG